MFELVCSNCGKTYLCRQNKRYAHCFCSKNCEAEFKKRMPTKKRKSNDIIICNNYAIIKIKNNSLGIVECLVDVEEVEKLKNYYWNVRTDKRHPNLLPYVESRIKKKRVHLHRYITNCPENMVVDHINGNTLDNRKCNLRICNQSINCINRTKSIGKYKIGVSFDPRRKLKKFNAYFRGKYLGSFLTESEAHCAYLVAKEKYITTYKIKSEIKQQNFS